VEIVFVDNNRIQNDGFCEEIMPLRSLAGKFEAFGCDVYSINGHNMEEIIDTLNKIHDIKNGLPKAVIAETIKGRGVSFMENVPKWHGMAPNDEEFKQGIAEIRGA
jgi:transketolase